MTSWLPADRPVYFHELTIPPNLRVLALAPHPDDFDAIGITLRQLQANGNPIFVAVLSSGCGGVEDAFVQPPTREEKTRVRRKEQRDSCRFFGLPEANLTFLELAENENGEILPLAENRELVYAYVAALQPNLIFLPSGHDTNPGHQQVFNLFRGLSNVLDQPVIGFLNEDPKTRVLRRDVLTVFDEPAARWKAELLRFHQSQHQRNLNTRGYGFDERILQMNRRIAGECGCHGKYAETFELALF